MVAIKNLFMFIAAASALVLPRDGAQTLTDLQTIDSDTNKLTAAINGWNGQVFSAIPITNAEKQVETDTKTATSNSNGVTYTESDASSIISYISNTLEPDIQKSLNALVAKKAQFKSAGLSNTVTTDIQNLQSETKDLSANLINGAPADQKSAGQAVADKIQADFTNALNNFNAS